MRRFFILCVAGAISVSVAVAQPPAETAPSFEETLQVRVVTVDVVVYDGDGNRVTGLGPEDFVLEEDGEPMEIAYFSEIREGEVFRWEEPDADSLPPAARDTSTVAGELDQSPPLRLAIFVDGAHTTLTSRGRFLEEVWPALEEGLGPRDRVVVAYYDGSLRIVTPFTTDRDAVRRGFEDVLSSPGLAATAEREERSAIDQIRQRQRSAVNTYERYPDRQFELPCPADLGVFARSHAASEYNRVMGSLSALQTLADSLAGLEGRTAIAHVSNGVPLVPGSSVYEFAISLCDGSGARSGLQDSFDVYSVDVDARSQLLDPNALRMEMQELNVSDELHRVASHANAHSVRLYTFDATGLRAAGTAAGAGMSRSQTELAGFSERRNLQDSLVQLADETGGRALIDSNRFHESLERMIGDLGSYYSLGYRPASLDRGRIHELKVKVKGRGMRVIAPASRRSKSSDEEVVDRMISAAYHQDSPNPLSVMAEARPDPDGERTLVRVAVPMHRLTLLAKDEHHEGAVTVFLSGRSDGATGTLAVRRRTMTVRVPSDRLTEALTESYTFGAALPGDLTGQTVAVGVRDELSGRVSFVAADVGSGGGSWFERERY